MHHGREDHIPNSLNLFLYWMDISNQLSNCAKHVIYITATLLTLCPSILQQANSMDLIYRHELAPNMHP